VTTVIHSPESDLALATTSTPLAAALRRDFPEVEATVRIEGANLVIREGNEFLEAKNFFYTEASIFSIFSFSFLEGTAATAFSLPNSIVLTRSAARQYFGEKPAMGQDLVCNSGIFRVSAIIEDRPPNSDLTIDALVAKDYSKVTNWTNDDFDTYTYVLFRQRPDLQKFNNRLQEVVTKYIQPEMEAQKATAYSFRFESEALADVHFSQGKFIDTPKGNRQFNRIFSVLAAFILLIALLNYINLSTARATERMKEVGVRKVIGARPGQLIRQFLGESSFLVGIAWLAAIGLVELSLPLFNRILSTKLAFSGWSMILVPLLLYPLTVVLAGLYPAFILSRFRPIKALKPGLVRQANGAFLRKTLTVVQFVIALAMLTGAIVFHLQMSFVAHKETGVDRAQVVSMHVPEDSASRARVPAFARRLRHEAGVAGVTVGSGLPTDGNAMSSTTVYSNGKKRQLMCNYYFIDPQFLPLLHISLAAGRNISDSFPTDKNEGYLVNEAFVKTMGWTQPLGQSIEGGFDGRKGKVIGVMKDFFFKSLHNMIEPMVMMYKTDPPLAVLARASPQKLSGLRQLWKEYFPSQPFNYSYMEEDFNKQYTKDRITLFLFNVFTGLAILLSCLGLYGLVSLITLQRTKEVGIRKVLGASLSGLIMLLSREQVWLIGLASLISLPLAAVGANRWLSTYAYHTSMNVWMFLLPVMMLLLMALAVTGYRILRSAMANPVESLRSE
jgi:putative ABC transport system permease protein